MSYLFFKILGCREHSASLTAIYKGRTRIFHDASLAHERVSQTLIKMYLVLKVSLIPNNCRKLFSGTDYDGSYAVSFYTRTLGTIIRRKTNM